jgi:hypothetical protein
VRICVQTTLYIQIIQSIIQCFLRQKYWLFYRTTWLWVNCLPFARTCVHSRFCFLGGVCLTLREDLCSLQVLFSWWDLSFPSRGSVLTPGFVFLVGSVLPFPETCVHSRFCFLGGFCFVHRYSFLYCVVCYVWFRSVFYVKRCLYSRLPLWFSVTFIQ